MAKIQDAIINVISDEDVEYLRDLANQLEAAPRMGNDNDSPEGVRYIRMSDTLAKEITRRLWAITGAAVGREGDE